MAYLYINGLEHGDTGACVTRNAPTVTAAQARTGTYSALFDVTMGMDKTLTSTYLTLASGVAIRPGALARGRILTVLGSTATEAYVECSGSGGAMNLYVSKVKVATGGQLALNTWTVLELICTKVIAEISSLTAKLYQDGVLVAEGMNAAASADELNRAIIGSPSGSTIGLAAYYDDWTIATGLPGRGGIELLVPSGAGTSTDLTPSAGANYAAVDEIPTDDDTTYVSGDTADDHDSYALSNLTLEGTVKAVQWNCRAKLAEEGSGHIKRVLRSGATDYAGDAIGLDVTYAWKSECFTNDPATDAAWARAAVDALEAGVMIA